MVKSPQPYRTSLQPSVSRWRALVVDDDARVRVRVSELLRARGYQVQEAETAEKALAYHVATPFDLVVLDWVLPGLDGLALCKRIRGIPGADVAVLMMTSRQGPENLQRILDAGATDYISKPVDDAALATRVTIVERRLHAQRARRLAETQLRLSEARLTAVVSNTADGVLSVDTHLHTVMMNDAAAELLATIGTRARPAYDLIDALPPSLRAQAREDIAAALSGEPTRAEWSVEGGGVVEVSIQAIEEDDARTGAVLAIRDVSERKRAEQDREESRQQLRRLLDLLPDAVVLSDAGKIVFANAALRRLLGLDAHASVDGESLHDHLEQEDDAHTVISTDAGALVTRKASIRNGSQMTFIEVVSGPMLVHDGVPLELTVLRDVTAKRKVESQLLLADRLASTGILAAGVAHEINNPLAAVLANVDYLVAELEQGRMPDDLLELVGEVRESALRMQTVVRDLGQVAGDSSAELEPVDVHSVVDAVAQMASNQIRHRASFEKRYGTIPPVLANESRLAQVMLNLLLNAAEALPLGEADKNCISVTTRTNDAGDVVIEVADTGRGIPVDLASRVFDPFFSTKSIGEGTGLGLAICHSVVRDFGGSIVVANPGSQEGAVMRVSLPASVGDAKRRTSVPPPSRAVAPVPARLLVVDDEALVRRSLKRALSPHKVVEASGGREALSILATESFDLILCDLMMPDVTGMQLYQLLKESHPGIESRVVFITGGAFTTDARRFVETVPNPVVTKPFDLAEVRQLVQRGIEAVRSGRAVSSD